MFKRIILLLGIAALALLCTYVLLILAARRAVEAEIRDAKAQGYPATLEELSAWTAQDQSSKAADSYLRAFDLVAREEKGIDLASLPFEPGDTKPLQRPLSEGSLSTIQTYLDSKRDALDALRAAAASGTCQFPLDASQLETMNVPHLGQVRNAVRLLALSVVERANAEDATGATESLLGETAIVRTLEEEPLLISQLARGPGVPIVMYSLEFALNCVDFSEGQLVQVGNALALADAPHSFERAYAGERCLDIAGFPKERLDQDEKVPRSASEFLYDALQWRVNDERYYLRAMRRLIAAASNPPYERGRLYSEVRPDLENTPGFYPLSKSTLAMFARSTSVDLRVMAQLRVARAAISVQRFRVAHQTLPDTLEEMMPAYLDVVPADPCSTGPIRYNRTGIRATVYSAGDNGLDEEGEGDDLAVVVQR